MAIGDIGANVLGSLEFDAVHCDYPAIARAHNTIALVLYDDANGDVKVVSIEVSAAGAITDPIKDSLIITPGSPDIPSIVERATGFHVMTFTATIGGLGHYTYAGTIQVDTSGNISNALISSLALETARMGYNHVIHHSGNTMVNGIGHLYSGGGAKLVTFGCSPTGTLGGSIIDSWQAVNGNFREIRLCKVSDTHIAVVGDYAVYPGYLFTVPVSVGGTITQSITDSWEFDATLCAWPFIEHMQGDIFAIAYTGPGTDGWLKTVQIDSSGNIGTAPIDTYSFNLAWGKRCYIRRVDNNTLAMVYSDEYVDGQVLTFKIDNSGNITEPWHDILEYDPVTSHWQQLVRMQGNIWFIGYQSTGEDGHAASVEIESPAGGFPKHLMTLGVG